LVESQDDEIIKATPNSIITKISVRMNNNVKTSTIEELRELKKSLHLNAFEYLLGEIKTNLVSILKARYVKSREEQDGTVTNEMLSMNRSGNISNQVQTVSMAMDLFLGNIFKDCEHRYARHKECRAEDFIQDELYRGLAKDMLDAGADIHARDSLGGTAFMKAAFAGHTDTLKSLLKFAVEKEKLFHSALEQKVRDEEKRSLLMSADTIEQGRVDHTRSLSSAVQLLNAKNNSGETALMLATMSGHLGTIQCLVELKCDVDTLDGEDSTAPMKAASFGHHEIVEFLYIHINSIHETVPGALIDQEDFKSRTALLRAAENGHTKVIKTLVRLKANIDHQDLQRRNSILFLGFRF
jgi:ankyrin repeat protein